LICRLKEIVRMNALVETSLPQVLTRQSC